MTQTVAALISFRTAAWFGRGFRSPLRDFLLADEVGPTHFGRAYGLERTADMVGAVIGPLVAAGLVVAGATFRTVILVSVVPSMISVIAIGAFTRDKPPPPEVSAIAAPRVPLPRAFWLIAGGVLLFGLGDFSRTFLIVIAAGALGTDHAGLLSAAVRLYAGHNAVSALTAYPAGKLGDATSKSRVLIAGYALGVITNLAFGHGHLPIVIAAIALSGVYIAIEETLEKAVVADLLPRNQRSLGLGILAGANAVGDLVSSLFVGLMLRGRPSHTRVRRPCGCGRARCGVDARHPRVRDPTLSVSPRNTRQGAHARAPRFARVLHDARAADGLAGCIAVRHGMRITFHDARGSAAPTRPSRR